MNEALRIDPRRAVVLTIDMQRTYLDAEVGTKVLPANEAEAVLASATRLLERCRALRVPVIHAYVNRRLVEVAARQGVSRFTTASRAVDAASRNDDADRADRLDGSPEAELPASLVRDGDIHIRSKKTTDSYFGTDLALLLEQTLRPATVILLGINTETCVYATAFGTKVRGYQPVVASDCVGSHRGTDNSWMALELMARTIAWVMPSSQIVAKLTAGGPST
jgi:nicotinamidase-related amidase